MRAALRVMLGVGLLLPASAAALQEEAPLRLDSIDAYLWEEDYEVALARSAAPAHVSDPATILVLGRDGHRVAHSGSNGFTCLVERSWSSPIGPHGDFFNPVLRAPICYNAEAARTILGDYLRRTELALEGRDVYEIYDTIKIEMGQGKLRPPQGLAMSYMMSGGQLLGTTVGRFRPHVMFYVPYATAEDLGAFPPGTMAYPHMFEHAGGPFAAINVPVAEFLEAPALPAGD